MAGFENHSLHPHGAYSVEPPKVSESSVTPFLLDDEKQLKRLLMLGPDGGPFNFCKQEKERETYRESVLKLIDKKVDVVDKVVEVVKAGKAIRPNSAMWVLAVCCCCEDANTRSKAYRAILDVCRTSTNLFQLISYYNHIKSPDGPQKKGRWGRGLRLAIRKWYEQYTSKPMQLALQVTKYRSGYKLSHLDLLRLSHLKPVSHNEGRPIDFIFRYVAKGFEHAKQLYVPDGVVDLPSSLSEVVSYLKAVEDVRDPKTSPESVCCLIDKHQLFWEHMPIAMLQRREIWESLLDKMPSMALLRNLNRMSSLLLFDDRDNVETVKKKLKEKCSREVHPYCIFKTWCTYCRGLGVKGKQKWDCNPLIKSALEDTFFSACNTAESTNKRIMVIINLNSSMCVKHRCNSDITPCEVTTAMSLLMFRNEKSVEFFGLSKKAGLLPLNIGRFSNHLQKAIDYMNDNNEKYGDDPDTSIDCTLPITWASKENNFEAFVIFTDSPFTYGKKSPVEALCEYREKRNIQNARLATIGLTCNKFTVADPKDVYMQDFHCFDVDTPKVLTQFIAGDCDE